MKSLLPIFLALLLFGAPALGDLPPSQNPPAAAPAQASLSGDSVTLKLKSGDDLLYTDDVKLNGAASTGPWLLNTGSNFSVVDVSLARTLKLEPAAASAGPNAQADPAAPLMFSVKSIDIAGFHTGPRWVVVADLSRQFGLHPKVQGILGSDVLGLLPFTVDFQQQTLTFHSRAAFHAPSGNGTSAALFGLWGRIEQRGAGQMPSELEKTYYRENPQAGHPVVRVKLDGVIASAMLDLGYAGRLSIGERFSHAHPAVVDPGAAAPSFIPANRQGSARVAKVSAMEVFGRTITDLTHSVAYVASAEASSAATTTAPAVDPEDAGRADLSIGRLVLNDFRLTFDYSAKMLWAEYRPMPSIAQRLAAGQLSANAPDLFGALPLMIAARVSDETGIAALLKAGANIAGEAPDGSTIFHIAAAQSSPAVLSLLLKQSGVTKDLINARTAAGITPLMAAAGAGGADKVAMLLTAGADARAATRSGATALHAAASSDAGVGCIKLLIDAGADVNASAGVGLTPIGVAAEHGSIASFDALAAAGAQLQVTQGDQISPLHLAARTGQTAMTQYILTKYKDRISIDAPMSDGSTALLIASESGNSEVVAALLKAGANPAIAAEGLNRSMPLHLAARKGNLKTIEVLLHGKAPIDAPNKQGLTPMMAAIDSGQRAAVEALIDAGASLDAKDADGLSPLHIAARANRPEIIRLLIQRKCDPNVKGPHDVTPLHIAVLNGALSSIQVLIELKANPSAPTTGGVTPLDLAKRSGSDELVKLLAPKVK